MCCNFIFLAASEAWLLAVSSLFLSEILRILEEASTLAFAATMRIVTVRANGVVQDLVVVVKPGAKAMKKANVFTMDSRNPGMKSIMDDGAGILTVFSLLFPFCRRSASHH